MPIESSLPPNSLPPLSLIAYTISDPISGPTSDPTSDSNNNLNYNLKVPRD